MESIYSAIFTAAWLGIITAVSPCPLATNIAAISYISRKVESTRFVLLSGLLYTIGRLLAYVGLGAILVHGMLSATKVSNFVNKEMNEYLGPLMIIIGMIILDMLTIKLPGAGLTEKLSKRAESFGILGSLLLGVIFALSFCPISAAYFFGGLIALAVTHSSTLLLPSVYGIGTALPVLVFAFVIALSASSIGKVYNSVSVFGRWAKVITGIIFIGVGIWFCLFYIFEIRFN